MRLPWICGPSTKLGPGGSLGSRRGRASPGRALGFASGRSLCSRRRRSGSANARTGYAIGLRIPSACTLVLLLVAGLAAGQEPADPLTLVNQGRRLNAAGKQPEAIRLYEQALEEEGEETEFLDGEF